MDSRPFVLGLGAALALSCAVRPQIHVPTFANGGMLRDTTQLAQSTYDALAAIWIVGGTGGQLLGRDVVTKAAVDRLSLFGRIDGIYSITEGGCLDGGKRVVFEGHWRYAENVDVGLVRLFVDDEATASKMCAGTYTAADLKTTTIEGFWGRDDEEPNAPLSVSFGAPLRTTEVNGLPEFLAGGHRSSATIQDYGVSENSLPGIRMIELLGAELAEMDTRRTKDGVIVLMHDDELSPRLVQGRFCKGYLSDLTLAELRANCRLENGEEIPTLDDALATAFGSTRLLGVWLDTKTADVLPLQIPLAAKFTAMGTARRAAGGLPFVVVDGMFEEALVASYLTLPHPTGTVCLVEYDPDAAKSAGCEYWAPRFTLGPQADLVSKAQANGLRVIYWTVNGTSVIDKFLTVGQPNGMISDTTGLVYYKYHVGDFTPRGRPGGP
ncbi:hypothetical protein BH09MYX1_BH09MYX1_51370 [soil metagenome]